MIIGICGLIGSGKGTVADTLVQDYGYTKISFADKLKDSVGVMFGWSRDMLDGKTIESREWREKVDEFWSKETGRTITPRLVLQEFGTECMRNGFYDGVWVSLVRKRVLDNPNTNFVVPDTRFPNEVDAIKSLGGLVWEVKRGEDPAWRVTYELTGLEPKNVHASEWAWIKSKKDSVITNDGTFDDLRSQVQDLLASI